MARDELAPLALEPSASRLRASSTRSRRQFPDCTPFVEETETS